MYMGVTPTNLRVPTNLNLHLPNKKIKLWIKLR